MNRPLIWDLPTRLFHWLFAGGVSTAAAIAFLSEDDSEVFPYHAMIGMTCTLMVCMRLVWGLVGTRYARFGTFMFGPGKVLEYFKGALVGGGERHLGHNPGSAYAIFGFFALMLALGVTGTMMGLRVKGVKDIHEVLAWSMLALIGAHVLGVVFHTLRWRENIAASMVHGRKQADVAAGIASARPIVAVAFLVVAGTAFGLLAKNYDPATRTTTIPMLNKSLKLGDVPERGDWGTEEHDERREHD